MTTQTDNPDYIEIPLSQQGKHAGKYVALVSPEDADLDNLRWSILWSQGSPRYAVQSALDWLMHRVILSRMLGRDLLPDEEVDHINRNGFDNRRCNLRLATHQQNSYNQAQYSNNTSGYKGVFRAGKRWKALIRVRGVSYYLGSFDDPQEAHAAYCAKAKELHGEFANFGDAE